MMGNGCLRKTRRTCRIALTLVFSANSALGLAWVRGCSWTVVFNNCQCTYSPSTSLVLLGSHLHSWPLEIQKEKLQLHSILCIVKSVLFFLVYCLMVSLSVHSFSFIRHNDLFQPPLFAFLYDFGFLLYCHSVITSVLGPSLLSFC